VLILKLTLVPAFVAIIALVGRYWGARLAGLLSGFPVIAGPIIYFLYLEQGVDFARAAVVSAIAGVVPLSSFCFIYAWSSRRFHWLSAILVSWAGYWAIAVVIVKLELSLLPALLLAVITVAGQIWTSPKHRETVGLTKASNSEIVVRMVCAAVLVMMVVGFANRMGSGYSGVLAAFPVASSVIAVLSHRNHSRYHAMDSLRALKFGLFSMLAFFTVLVLLMEAIPFAWAFMLAVPVALIAQGVIWAGKQALLRLKATMSE
jgi:hypothetical protein